MAAGDTVPTPTTEIILSPAPALQPATLFTPTPKAARRVLEFFTAQVNNNHTRKAYLNPTRRFAAWCDQKGIGQLADVQAFHVAAFPWAGKQNGGPSKQADGNELMKLSH